METRRVVKLGLKRKIGSERSGKRICFERLTITGATLVGKNAVLSSTGDSVRGSGIRGRGGRCSEIGGGSRAHLQRRHSSR